MYGRRIANEVEGDSGEGFKNRAHDITAACFSECVAFCATG